MTDKDISTFPVKPEVQSTDNMLIVPDDGVGMLTPASQFAKAQDVQNGLQNCVQKGDSGWIDYPASGNVSASSSKYRKYNGVVYLQLTITCEVTSVIQMPALPEGYRPSTGIAVTVLTRLSAGVTTSWALVQVQTSGRVVINANSQTTPYEIVCMFSYPA